MKNTYNPVAMKLIALACIDFLTAHAKRNPDNEWPTLNERTALVALETRLAALRREDAEATAGTAV